MEERRKIHLQFGNIRDRVMAIKLAKCHWILQPNNVISLYGTKTAIEHTMQRIADAQIFYETIEEET